MAARSAAGAPLSAFWFLRRLHFRHDRRRRPVRPVVEAIESRLLLAGTSPTNPVPIRTKPTGTPTPQQLGAAYRQVVAIQTTTLQSLSDSHREVAAAAAQFAGRTAVTIDELSAELSHANDPHQAAAIATAIRRDRQILNLGEAAAARTRAGARRGTWHCDPAGDHRQDLHPQRSVHDPHRTGPAGSLHRRGDFPQRPEIGECLGSQAQRARIAREPDNSSQCLRQSVLPCPSPGPGPPAARPSPHRPKCGTLFVRQLLSTLPRRNGQCAGLPGRLGADCPGLCSSRSQPC